MTRQQQRTVIRQQHQRTLLSLLNPQIKLQLILLLSLLHLQKLLPRTLFFNPRVLNLLCFYFTQRIILSASKKSYDEDYCTVAKIQKTVIFSYVFFQLYEEFFGAILFFGCVRKNTK